jgi:hypothetical protein
MIVNKHYLRNETSRAFIDSFLAISMVMYRIVKLKDKKICITILKTVSDIYYLHDTTSSSLDLLNIYIIYAQGDYAILSVEYLS